MSMRYPGGFIASTPVTANYPSGVWTQAQAIPYQAQNVWTRDQYWPYTTLLLQGNGTNGAQNNTFLDSSSNNFTITRNGNTTQGSFTPYEQDGYWSNYFDGTGDYLRVADSTAFDLPGDFTLEFWIYPTASGFGVVLGSEDSGQNGFVVFNGTNMGVYGNGASIISVSSAIVLNAWQHIAVVRSGTSLKFYLNGTERGSATNSTSFTGVAGNGFAVAATYTNTYITSGTGYFSNVRLVKSAVYTTNFTPPTAPLTAITNTSLLTCQSNRFIDNSTNAFAITVNGNTSVQAFQPFPGATTYSGTVLGGSGYFDGSGDYLSVADNAAFNLNGVSFTVECWVYWNSVSGEQNIVEQFTGPGGPGWTFYKFAPGAGSPAGTIDFYGGGGSINSGVSPVAGQWYHLAVSRNNSTGTTSFYVNGTRTATATFGVGSSSATALLVGVRAGGTTWINGYIGDLRVVKGSYVYDPTATTITVPTAPLTAITNTSLLLNFTNAGIFDAAVMNDLETVGNAQVSTSVVKYGTGSMAFDGSGDYLVPNGAGTNLGLVLGTGDFTIEFWVYFNSGLGSDIVLYDSRPLSTNGVYPTLYVNSSSQLSYVVSSSDRITATSAFTTGVWYHIALCRAGTSTRMYINGVQTGSTYSDSNNYLNPARRPVIAINGFNETAAPLNGYIDDLRITKGAARYIGNFTPPVARMPQQ